MSHGPTPLTSTAPGAPAAGEGYRYDRFTTRLMLADLRFGADAPRPGSPFPTFALDAPGGGSISSASLAGRPFLLILGSLTCPMTAGSAAGLLALHEAFGAHVEFVSVYAREAHPGERIPQASTAAEKRTNAEALAARDGYAWPIAVDSLDGALHRQLDAKPNAAFLVDASGQLAFRSIWAADDAGLRAALAAVVGGERPRRGTSTAMVGPMLRALPWIDLIVRGGGRSASRDLWRAAPPMALMARMARAVCSRGHEPGRGRG
ncbi:MAG: TlpA family protein disulfide reductase [Dehalococcoidia bacterium]